MLNGSPNSKGDSMNDCESGSVAHSGHPVPCWMMDSIYIRTDPAGGIKADKEKSTEKTDGAIQSHDGCDRAVRCGNGTKECAYDIRGFCLCKPDPSRQTLRIPKEDRRLLQQAELPGAYWLPVLFFPRQDSDQRKRSGRNRQARDMPPPFRSSWGQ